jgi:3-hydroxybutyryl-CoA dehydrogenase
MGTGIAHAFVSAGFETSLVDLNEAALQQAESSIAAILGDGVRIGKIEAPAAAEARDRLRTSSSIEIGAAEADLLIETVSEQLSVKLAVIAAAEHVLAPGAVIATNTSALSVTEIASASNRPQRVAGMHFFNPVHKMKLVELVRGLQTEDDTISELRNYCAAIGKTSILVNEAPGLTTSRMSAMLGNEAMYMLMEGTATAEDIDTAHRLGFNHPLGPLELGDVTGWDTRLSVLRYLHQTLGEKFRPCPLIVKMVAAGRFGRKSGAGVYEYEDGQKIAGSGLRAGTL